MTNFSLILQIGTRTVRNRSRAHKLQKRGEWIRWNAEKGCWEWTPCATREKHFQCPFCKGRHWGTSVVKDWHGQLQKHGRCHTPNCDMEWDRRDDDDFFVWEFKPTNTKFEIRRIAA